MQAFRTATTVDEERQLRIPGVPFQPGTSVDVIVLERGEPVPALSPALKDQPGSSMAALQQERQQLAEEQYRLADQYPDEYVILIGDRIVHHSADRLEAVQAYRDFEADDMSNRPVIVSPGKSMRKPPMARGRALTGKLPWKR